MQNNTESPMKFENLEQRVLVAKTSPGEMNSLIEEYIPFIRKTAVKVIPSGAYDSFSTTAMSAFAEAVEKFRDNEGRFLGYASLVITNRIKDQVRKEFKPDEIPRDEIEIIEPFEEKADRKLEVDMFRDELSDYGIMLEDLLKDSPKHKGSRIKANKAAETLSGNRDLFNRLVDTKKVPVKRLVEMSGVATKLIEQKRKYIIARTLLRQDKYTYLREFAE